MAFLAGIAGMFAFGAWRHHRASSAFTIEGHAVVARGPGLRIPLSEAWTFQKNEPGVDFVATHESTGAVLTGQVSVERDAAKPIAKVLDEVVEGRRKKWGAVEQEERGQAPIGDVNFAYAEFVVPRGDEKVNARVYYARRRGQAITLSCGGHVLAQQACGLAFKKAEWTH